MDKFFENHKLLKFTQCITLTSHYLLEKIEFMVKHSEKENPSSSP